MKKIPYAFLGILFALSATAGFAQVPDLPKVSEEDEATENSLDPLLEVPSEAKAPALPAAPAADPNKEKILDKAIDEVFQEPKTEEKKPEEKKSVIEIDTNKVDETPAPAQTEAPTVDEAAEPPITIEDEPKAPAAEEAKPAEETKPTADTIASEPKKEEKAAEEKPVTETKKAEAKKPAAKKHVKKVSMPKQTPKSLREDYREQKFDGNGNYIVPAPVVPAPTYSFPPNTKPISRGEQPKSMPKSMQEGSVEEDGTNDLDVLKDLPSKKKVLALKSDININRGGFSSPFAEGDTDQDSAGGDDDLTSADMEDGHAAAPVVDLSESASLSETSNNSKSGTAKNFYMEDSGLEVEVKDAPKNDLDTMKNAYEALQVGQYESAIKYYNDALSTNPNNKKALFGVATAYHMSKDYEKAKESYLKIIKIDPDYWPAVNNYIILVSDENPEKAIPRLEELYTKNPSFAAIPAQLGNLYYKKGMIEKSVYYYLAAIRSEPENIEYRYNLAVILEKTSNKKEAAELYRSLLDDAAQGKALPESVATIQDRYDQLISIAN